MSLLDLDAVVIMPRADTNQLKLRELSYSSSCTLHSCPRKYLLDKAAKDRINIQSVTFAFGHAVGEGIQQVLLGASWGTVLFEMFKLWDVALLDEEPKAKKSIWEAVLAVQKFKAYYDESGLSGYEVATINGVKATELSFKITLPDGYVYRGYVDVVLSHKHTGRLLVLEIKTSGAYTLNEAQYKNSNQALGYTILLDTINPEATKHSFEVRYLVYKTRAQEFQEFSFVKMFSQKLDWIQSILSDCDNITRMTDNKHFPKHGESCFNFFRQCNHFTTCNLKDTSLGINYEAKSVDTTQYTIDLNIVDILNALDKGVTNG